MFLGAEAIRAEGRRSRTSRHDIKENGTIVVVAPTFPIGGELARCPTVPEAISPYAQRWLRCRPLRGTASAAAVVVCDRHAEKHSVRARESKKVRKEKKDGTQNPNMPIWVNKKQIRVKKTNFRVFLRFLLMEKL